MQDLQGIRACFSFNIFWLYSFLSNINSSEQPDFLLQNARIYVIITEINAIPCSVLIFSYPWKSQSFIVISADAEAKIEIIRN